MDERGFLMANNSGLDVAREFLRAMVDESRVHAAENYLADDAILTINGVEYSREEYINRLKTSDERFEVLDVNYRITVEAEKTIGIRHELLFEHRGTAYGVEPEHERFQESSASFFEIEDGEIQNLDVTYDPTATLEQLGLLSADPTTEKLRDQYYEILNRVLRHNLRNKLNLVLASAETLRHDPDEAADTIEETTNELLTTVEKAQKIEQMAIDAPLQPTTFDVTETVTDVLDQYERRHDVTCSFDRPPQPLELRSDKRLFQNALEEALQNAILYNEVEAPEVTVTVGPATAEEYVVELTVEDNGPGIPESELEPLRQDEETQLLHGSGIGLWIIKWCMTRLDGQLAFNDGDSSAVHLAFPDLNH